MRSWLKARLDVRPDLFEGREGGGVAMRPWGCHEQLRLWL